jgi:hypothetical protein
MEAAAAVVSLSGVATMITAAPANAPKKSKAKKPSPSKKKTLDIKVKKPAPPSDDQVCWLHFSDLCRYKANHGTMSVPRSKDGTNNVLANWIHYIRKRYKSNALRATHKSILNGINFEWTAGQFTKKDSKAGLPNFWSTTSKMALSKFWGITKNNTCSLPSGETMQREQPSQCQ